MKVSGFIKKQLSQENYKKFEQWTEYHSNDELKELEKLIKVDSKIFDDCVEGGVNTIFNFISFKFYHKNHTTISKQIKNAGNWLQTTEHRKMDRADVENILGILRKQDTKEQQKKINDKFKIDKTDMKLNQRIIWLFSCIENLLNTTKDKKIETICKNWITPTKKEVILKKELIELFRKRLFKYIVIDTKSLYENEEVSIGNMQQKLSKEEFINNYETVKENFLKAIKNGKDLTLPFMFNNKRKVLLSEEVLKEENNNRGRFL